ncbi:unnamed protein product [Paramecium octaurelia]|uniref:TLDc domain-containing protein n=1 Tax=Paramecium octaurelia TaxID=43137 RepID=A0A8S1YHK4_PAROT|nr:unnamed protein product [Paramecium octaurelia]CAD8214096.1 unnamed protein product [Paramecium octaurelia]
MQTEIQKIICQNHQRDIIAMNLDSLQIGQIQYLCCKCLVEKMNDDKIQAIEEIIDRISSLKTQKKDLNKIRLLQEHTLLNNGVKTKRNVEATFDKIHFQIQAQICTIQQEHQSFLEQFKVEQTLQKDISSLAEFFQIDIREKQLKFQQDIHLIEEIEEQFELFLNNQEYFQALVTFKVAKQKINEVIENVKVGLMPHKDMLLQNINQKEKKNNTTIQQQKLNENTFDNIQIQQNVKIAQNDLLINKIIKELELKRQFIDPILQLKPTLLRDDYWHKLFYILQAKMNRNIRNSILIYQGSKDGLNAKQYWYKVNGRSNLLMIFQSKSNYIFGTYSPCTWESKNGVWVEDNTLSSFIFSQTHDQVYPLKQDKKQQAIGLNSSYGPLIGGGDDLFIDGDFTQGYSRLGGSYQFQYYQQGNNEPYLYGQIQPEIKECEIYQLLF